ncbi:hypothetical protein [Clostridium estertheticum]|uniref:hypothetical protein n=1 Tax=Clostridium estertheticum TaxID=238834 RepID=UPI001CF3704C|nr:hypothetical protein [Clostridium estertheticum]MCB2361687.1 hypothetical protein [Clostridium estertheticum]
MEIKKIILKSILTFLVLLVSINLHLNSVAQFIIIFLGVMTTTLLVDYFLNKKS